MAVTTGYRGIGSRGKDGGCVAATVVARTAAGPGWGKCGSNNSSEIGGDAVMAAVRTIAREMRRDKGNTATTTGYCGDGGGKVDSDGGGKSKGSAATTAGYPGNSGGGNEDDSKGNSGENREHGGNNGGGISHPSLIFFFLVGLRTRSQGLFFCSIHICHIMTQTTAHLYM